MFRSGGRTFHSGGRTFRSGGRTFRSGGRTFRSGEHRFCQFKINNYSAFKQVLWQLTISLYIYLTESVCKPQIRNYAHNNIQKRKESASLVKRGAQCIGCHHKDI